MYCVFKYLLAEEFCPGCRHLGVAPVLPKHITLLYPLNTFLLDGFLEVASTWCSTYLQATVASEARLAALARVGG
jgi:hypothetical protein